MPEAGFWEPEFGEFSAYLLVYLKTSGIVNAFFYHMSYCKCLLFKMFNGVNNIEKFGNILKISPIKKIQNCLV